jgi:ketosteroid isomerase-like protein
MSAALDAVRSHYAASDRGDLDGMLAVLAPDVRWTEAAGFPLAGTYIGPTAVADGVFRRLQEDWDGFSLTVDEVLDAGDRIVGVGTYRGTSPTTGRSFEARVVHLWTVQGGRAVAFEQIVDSALVVAVMG